jgi:hypothetical protein
VNDFILNIDKDTLENVKNAHIFLLYYRRDFQSYYLRNVNENKETFFIFVFIDKPLAITGENTIVSVLNYNFKLSVDPV